MGQFRLPALAGLAVVAAAALAHNLPGLAPGMRDWAEPGNVAAALAQGRGFSDPFDGGTGATAWVSPLPVWVEAAAFLLFGVKTAAAAKALLVLAVLGLAGANALLLSALAPFGAWARGAASAAFLAYCALLPGGPLEVLSEAWLDILISAALLWAALETRRFPEGPGRLVLPAVALAAPLDNAGLALSTGIVLLALAWSFRGDIRRLRVPAAAAAVAAAAVGGWTGRNAVALGRFVPLKSNSWFELHLANVDSADGLPRMETVLRTLPYFDIAQFERYARLGEAAYVDTFRAPALAALRGAPLHFAGNVLRRAADAAVFCRREGGGAFTRFGFRQEDAIRLVASGDLILLGKSGGGLWARIDADPADVSARLHGMGLADEGAIWRDWAEKRLAYDARFRGAGAIATGFLTAGIPVGALLLSALLLGGRLAPPAAWAAAIGFGMLLPFVLVNHNERHQLPLVAMQAVAVGACVQACAGRLGKEPEEP
ncbi:MAG TPA: hypothetical protein VN775_13335 [Opitutaceae bacterium]|nr:hypothetical protein [Opitutaceae bacterium]